jgi:hypothetical protein
MESEPLGRFDDRQAALVSLVLTAAFPFAWELNCRHCMPGPIDFFRESIYM